MHGLDMRQPVQVLHHFVRHGLPGQHDMTYRAGDAVDAEQRAHAGGDGVDEGDLVAGGQGRQRQQILRQHDRTAGGQGRENLQQRQIETHRRDQGHARVDIFGQRLLHPDEVVQHAQMVIHHPLRPPGGAGGKEHAKEVQRRDR